MPITKEQKQAYLQHKGTHCLYCGSINIQATQLSADADVASCETICKDCKKEWVDFYFLTDVAELVR